MVSERAGDETAKPAERSQPPTRRAERGSCAWRDQLFCQTRLRQHVGAADRCRSRAWLRADHLLKCRLQSRSAALLLNDLNDKEASIGPLAAELRSEEDPAQLVAKAVHITRQLNERCGDLIRVLLSAEPAEPDVAAAVADGMRRHDEGASSLGRQLASMGALPAEVTAEHAAAAFGMMTSPASWRQLTQGAGWSFDDSEVWLTDSVVKLLLVNQRHDRRSRGRGSR